MGYRQVVIKKGNKLHLEDNQLCLQKELEEIKIPLEDINFILIEDTTMTITSKLLSEIGKYSISMIFCDEKHEPSSILYPYNYHFKQLEVLEHQLQMQQEMKDNLWTIIIKRKIENQLAVLEMRTKNEEVIKKIREFLDTVEVGDKTNREGLSAKMYFRDLFGSKFIRFYDDGVNAALNYGYTIIKSSIVRTLATYGLNTYLGINHKSKTNNFNLAFDLLEPYRALVDKYVFDHIEEVTDQLSFNFRKQLVNLLNKEVIVNKKHCTVEYSIELLIKSYVKCMVTGEVALDLPNLIYD